MYKLKLLLSSLILLTALQAYGQRLLSSSQPSIRFAVVGDTGTGGKAQYEVAGRLTSSRVRFPFDFVLLVGDNLYGSESPMDFQTKFELPFQRLLMEGVKFYATLGNHDEPSRQTVYKPFNMDGSRYYTFKPKKGIQFFSLDSTYMDRKQLEWFEKELRNSDSEWKICFFHHPLYSSGEKHGSDIELRRLLEPLMVQYGVDIVLTGHEHFYERLKPQYGVFHFIVGSSAKLRRGNITKSKITAKGFDQDHVFMVMEIGRDEMAFQTISRTGAIVDSGKIRPSQIAATAAEK
jgi:DNA repair exonuclease SbcCD nuclease subunit